MIWSWLTPGSAFAESKQQGSATASAVAILSIALRRIFGSLRRFRQAGLASLTDEKPCYFVSWNCRGNVVTLHFRTSFRLHAIALFLGFDALRCRGHAECDAELCDRTHNGHCIHVGNGKIPH